MAVELTATSQSFIGTGGLSVYSTDIYYVEPEQMVVTVNSVLQTLGDDYTVSGAESSFGADVTATFPLGALVVVKRRTAITQEVDTQNNETILEDVLDAGFDKLTMIDQEQQGQIDALGVRPVQVPDGETIPPLDFASGRAGKLLTFDADGDPETIIPKTKVVVAPDVAPTIPTVAARSNKLPIFNAGGNLDTLIAPLTLVALDLNSKPYGLNPYSVLPNQIISEGIWSAGSNIISEGVWG